LIGISRHVESALLQPRQRSATPPLNTAELNTDHKQHHQYVRLTSSSVIEHMFASIPQRKKHNTTATLPAQSKRSLPSHLPDIQPPICIAFITCISHTHVLSAGLR
jgi:hypothetical protein